MAAAGRRVLVTGATSGIGAGIARASRLRGTRSLRPARRAEVAGGAAAAGIGCGALDVRDGDGVAALVGGLGELDVVVNCAGVIRRGLEHDPAVFAEAIDINLTGTMRVCAPLGEGLKARRGCIVNTASMLSFFGGGLVPGYSASKGGVAQLTKSLAIAYAADGIRVNAVAPGWIATPLTQALQDDAARSGADPRAHADGPLGHAGRRRRPGAVPGQRRRRASSPASCCRSTAATSSPEGGYR